MSLLHSGPESAAEALTAIRGWLPSTVRTAHRGEERVARTCSLPRTPGVKGRGGHSDVI